MTSPLQQFSYAPQQVVNSATDAYDRELAAYYAARQINAAGMDGNTAQVQHALIAQSGQLITAPWKDEDLVGAATFWGIPEAAARAMPRDQLIALVNEYRSKARPEDLGTQLATGLAAVPAMFGVGAGEAITGGLQRLPLVGEWMSRQKVVHDADLWMRQLEEGVRASTPEWEQPIESGANIAGNIAAMWYPASAVWAASGIVGAPVAALTGSRLALTAFQGGLSAYLLEGGSQEFKEHPLMSMAGGAAIGVGMEAAAPYVMKLAQRITRRFMLPASALDGPLQGPWSSGSLEGPWPSGAQHGPNLPPDAEDALQRAAEQGDESAKNMLDYLAQQRAPSRSSGMDTHQAESLAAQMNKSATIVQSPAFAEIGGRTDITESAVAEAARATNPGAASIIPGVSDPASIMQTIGENVAFARRNGRLDALIVPVDRDAAGMVSEYEQHGVFTGQTVLDPHGVEAQIEFIHSASNRASVKSNGGPAAVWPIAQLQPRLSSPQVMEVPGLWQTFRSFSDQKAAEAVEAMGGMTPGQTFQLRSQNMLHWAEQFLDMAGVTSPGDRSRIISYFDRQYVAEMQNIAPAETVQQHTALAELHSLPANSAEIAQRSWYHGGSNTAQYVNDRPVFLTTIPEVANNYAMGDYSTVEGVGRITKAQIQIQHPATSKDVLAAVQQTGLSAEDIRLARGARQPAWEAETSPLDALYHPHVRRSLENSGFDGVVDWDQYDAPYFDVPAAVVWNTNQIQRVGEAAPMRNWATDAGLQFHPAVSLETLDEAAAIKGYVALVEGPSITLQDVGGGSLGGKVRFDGIDSAHAWVTKLDRELTDISPPSAVPLELVGLHMAEPLQASNINSQSLDKLADVVREQEAGEPPVGPPVDALHAQGNVGELKNRFQQAFSRWAPARRLFSKLDEVLHDAGFDVGFSKDYFDQGRLLTIHHNNMHEYQNRLADITTQISTPNLVSGQWGRIWLMGPGPAQDAAAQAAGMVQRESAQFKEFDKLLEDVGGSAADVRAYMTEVAQRQSDPSIVEKWPSGSHDQLPLDLSMGTPPLSNAVQPFFDHANTSNLNLRQLDPRYVGDSYIRSVMWGRDMEGPWQGVNQRWKGLVQDHPELEPASNLMQQWLGIMKFGYHAEDDLATDVVHGLLRRVMGPEVTKEQAIQFIQFGLSTTHNGMLGYRPSVMARDALQLFFAVPRAGTHLLGAMRQWMTDPAFRTALWTEAVNDGAVSLTMPRMASPGSFTGELEAAGAGFPTRPLGWRMRTAAGVTNAVREMMPTWLRDLRDSPLHPLYFYGKQQELMRALVYKAGKDRAAEALAAYRGTGDLAGLMKESGARTYDLSWQRQFQDIVASGNDEAAARYMGHQLADATQFKYGVTESPFVAKAPSGRIGMQFGSFTIQYIQYLRESIQAGTRVGMQTGDWSDLVKFLTTAGTVTAGLEAAKKETGWNFRWMNPYYSVGFVGGPWVSAAVDVSQGVGSVLNATQGQPMNQQAMAAGVDAAVTIGTRYANPLGGAVRTARGLAQASQSPYPGLATARHLITGEIGAEPDVVMQNMPQAQEFFRRSLQQHPNPTSMTRESLPPGMFPQQTPTYPPMIQPSIPSMPGGFQQHPTVTDQDPTLPNQPDDQTEPDENYQQNFSNWISGAMQ